MTAISAANKAYDYLYNEILNGNLKLGAPIAEAEVSRTMGLSRSPVREALKRMEVEGLVKHYPGRGVFVTDITEHDLEEIFELRIMFEIAALKTSISRISQEKLEELEEILVSIQEGADEDTYFKTNTAVHDLIMDYCGNYRMRVFLNTLSSQIAIVNRISSQDPSHFENSTRQHLEIIRAIKERDLEKAEKCLRKHLEDVRNSTVENYNYRRR